MVLLAAEEETSGLRLFIPAWPEIIWSAVFLAVLILVLGKFAFPRMLKLLDERSARIEGGLKQAEKVQDEVNRLRSHQEQELATARQQAAEIREKARQDGAKILEETKARAEAENERLLAAGRQQLEAERQSTVRSLQGEVGSLAGDLASKIVGESLADDARSQRVIDRFLDELDQQTTARAGE